MNNCHGCSVVTVGNGKRCPLQVSQIDVVLDVLDVKRPHFIFRGPKVEIDSKGRMTNFHPKNVQSPVNQKGGN